MKTINRTLAALAIVALTAAGCAPSGPAVFAQWMLQQTRVGPFVRPASKIAALHLDAEELRALFQSSLAHPIDDAAVEASVTDTLYDEWPDGDLAMQGISRGANGEIWVRCSRPVSATRVDLIEIAMEERPAGKRVISCAFMDGTS